LVSKYDLQRLWVFVSGDLLYHSPQSHRALAKQKSMKKIIAIVTIVIASTSCSMFKTITSNTTIQPNDSFVLGDNVHGEFSVKFKNVSKNAVTVYRAPNEGGKHSFVTVQPNETVKVNVESNTALVVENKSHDVASVDLLVKGDTGLSMGYKK
jgi:uncharacterized protein YxeA